MMNISVPGKTFLIGEYAVLRGGNALIATHQPFFDINIKNGKPSSLPFAEESPAGKYYLENQASFGNKVVTFSNPYKVGGLGASTAEFLSLYYFLNQHSLNSSTNQDLLDCYWKYATTSSGEKPSGADLISQARGELCLFNAKDTTHHTFAWPFKELAFIIIHTKKKLATHTHLSNLTLNHIQPLVTLSRQLQSTLETKATQVFLTLIQDYSDELLNLKLVATHTKNLLEELLALPDVLTAKGCGAMGADTILILCQQENFSGLSKKLMQKGHPIIATSNDIALIENR